MDPLTIVEKLKEATKDLLEKEGAEIVDLIFRREGGAWVLRFSVDKAGGITLSECANLNHKLSALLDELNLIEERYLLEVSSPGLDRPLTKRSDFLRVIDKEVRFTYKTIEDKVDVVVGLVKDVDDEKVFVEKEGGSPLEIPIRSIIKAKEEVRF